jgi:hypothetical protein
MAQPGCSGPLCDFTGSRLKSEAKPGRCTKEGGYLAFAEIWEIFKAGDDVLVFHDDDSDSDIMLHKGSPYTHHRYTIFPAARVLT